MEFKCRHLSFAGILPSGTAEIPDNKKVKGC
jgi:hypothetical protein